MFKKTRHLICIATIIAILTYQYIQGYNDGDQNNQINFGSGFNAAIHNIRVQEDGKILIGGSFTEYQGIIQNYLIRLTTDGAIDTGFNIGSGFDGSVYTLHIQEDGKILVGGEFTQFNNENTNRFVRLNIDGSIDETFNIGSGFDGPLLGGGPIPPPMVNAIAIQDGKILVGGRFSRFDNTDAKSIIRLNTNGTRDEEFIGDGFDGMAYGLTIQDDEKIIVGGSFTTYNNEEANHLVRLHTDGSKDTGFNIGSGFNGDIYTIHVQEDGKIIVGGSFTTYNNEEANCLIRLHADGSKDTGFNVGSGFNGNIYTIHIEEDDKIIVGGAFTTYNNEITNRLIRLNTNGSKDISFNIGSGFDNEIRTIQRINDESIIVGGYFTNYQGNETTYITTLHSEIADIYPPTGVSLIQPGHETIRNTGTIIYKRTTATDTGSGISGYTYDIIPQGEDTSVQSGFITGTDITLSGLSDGIYQRKVLAIDNNNIYSSENELRTFTIDTVSPMAEIGYSTTNNTTQAVIASLTGISETITGYETLSHTFASNGEYTFYFQDLAGNTGSKTASVSRIQTTTIQNNPGGGGGGITLTKDICPNNKDCSPSYYDGKCGVCKETAQDIVNQHGAAKTLNEKDNELIDAYKRAFNAGITDKKTITEASLTGKLTRVQLAKIIIEYAKELGIYTEVNKENICTFKDIQGEENHLQEYIIQACKQGLMGLKSDGAPNTTFSPKGIVTRAQLATVISRLLYQGTYNTTDAIQRYKKHLRALQEIGIITRKNNISDPEIRGWTFVILYRINEKITKMKK